MITEELRQVNWSGGIGPEGSCQLAGDKGRKRGLNQPRQRDLLVGPGQDNRIQGRSESIYRPHESTELAGAERTEMTDNQAQ